MDTNKLLKFTNITLMIVIVALSGYGYFRNRAAQRAILELQNTVAINDKTIEVQKDLYAKRTQEVEELTGLLGKASEKERQLQDELKKTKSKLLSVTQAYLKLKEQVAAGAGSQTVVVGPDGKTNRLRVDFLNDFGWVLVKGYTLTDPPEYHLTLGQGSRPLKLTTVVTQQPDGSWKSYVQSSEEGVEVDIGLSAVNPHITDPEWYEKLKVHMDLGVGGGVLAGAGLAYQFGSFDLGGSIWGVTSGGGSVFYGINFSWAPFKK